MRIGMHCTFLEDFDSNASKYRLADTQENFLRLDSYQFHLCNSMHVDKILQVDVEVDLEFDEIEQTLLLLLAAHAISQFHCTTVE